LTGNAAGLIDDFWVLAPLTPLKRNSCGKGNHKRKDYNEMVKSIKIM